MLHELNPFIRFAKIISFSGTDLETSIAFDNRLFVCLEGKLKLSSEEELCLGEGDAAFIPQYMPYRLYDLNCRMISFNFDLTAVHSDITESLRTHPYSQWDGMKLHKDISLPPLDGVRKFDISEVKQVFVKAADAFQSGADYCRELASAYLKRGIIGMLTNPGKQHHAAVEMFIEIVDNHYDKDITASAAAVMIGYHEVYLNRLVKSELGVSVSEYIIEYRIAKAKRFLDMGYSVTETATLCGFSELTYFSRCFKKREGVTPREYRRFSGLL